MLSAEKSFAAVARTAEEKATWIADIAAAVAECQAGGSAQEEAAEAAPVWTPAMESCQLCAAKFNLLKNRRHHCRSCGRCVCAGCSPHTRERRVPSSAEKGAGPKEKLTRERVCVAVGDKVIKRRSPLNVLKYTSDRSCY